MTNAAPVCRVRLFGLPLKIGISCVIIFLSWCIPCNGGKKGVTALLCNQQIVTKMRITLYNMDITYRKGGLDI